MSRMRIDILTLFPEMCETVMGESIIGRARQKGIIEFFSHQIRDYTQNRQKQVDDHPYGGGMGMVMNAQPIMDCYRDLCEGLKEKPHTIYMSPKGKTLDQETANRLSQLDNICVICGHYEGVDQRLLDKIVDEEISIGDYVLTGGELPALVMVDSVARLVPGVLSDEACFTDESHYSGMLEYPHYTRPEVWEGAEVPEVLLSGHHANIYRWRFEKSVIITLENRPDMLEKYLEGYLASEKAVSERRKIRDLNNDAKKAKELLSKQEPLTEDDLVFLTDTCFRIDKTAKQG